MHKTKYAIIPPMKLRILLAILFVITTTLSALHELKHITHDNDNDASCLVYHINDKMSSVAIVDFSQNVFVLYPQIIPYVTQVLTLHQKDKSNSNRAPPFYS